jgi:hypothetical protein
MIRLLAPTALLGVLLAVAPAWAQTSTTKMHHRARHAVHHTASTEANGTGASSHRHHFVAGDDSAEMLNRQVLQSLQKGG